jgi:hypothetical protein
VGPGPDKIMISGGNAYQPFQIAVGSTSTISGITIANGFATTLALDPESNFGGGIKNSGTLTITNCVIRDNRQVGSQGGGIFSDGTLRVVDSIVSNNRAEGATGEGGVGGGIVNAGDLVLERCTFRGNGAVGGPGQAGALGTGAPGTPGQYGQGGALYNFKTASIRDCLFLDNTATGGAGGNGANPRRIGIGLEIGCDGPRGAGGDGGLGEGGAIFYWSQTPDAAFLNMTNCTFSGNRAIGGNGGFGGFCLAQSGEPGKPGQGRGGAVAARYFYQLVHCTVAENRVEPVGQGGGLLLDDYQPNINFLLRDTIVEFNL